MSNPVTGEVNFECGGKNYTFRLGTYALAVLQRRTKIPTLKFFRRPADEMGADEMLSIFYAGLYRTHKLSEEQVADLMDELGQNRLAEILKEGIGSAMGTGEASGDPDPQMPAATPAAANGTGSLSSANGLS